MEENISSSLRKVIVTLNGVSAEGEKNWDRLLGSIQELKRLVLQLEQEAAQEKTEKE